MRFVISFVLACTLLPLATALAEDPFLLGPDARRWEPVADAVYLQERAERRPTPSAVQSVALHDGTVYVVMDGTLHEMERQGFRPLAGAPESVNRVMAVGGNLWLLADHGLYRKADGGWTRLTDAAVADLCEHLGAVHAASGQAVYRVEGDELVDIAPEGGYRSTNTTFEMEDGTQILRRPVTWGALRRIASYCATMYGMRPGSLALFDGEAIDDTVADWGTPPSSVIRDILPLGSRLFIATDRGLGVLRGMSMTSLRGADGLPFEDTTCLAEGFDNDLWVGTSRGAIRMVKDEWHFFGAQHWLPGDYVHDIAAGADAIYIATDGGLGIVHYEPYTLLKKAAHYERRLDEYGHKRLGFTHKLYWAGDDLGWIREISDNDGGHTAHYLVAMSFKYAVTGDPAARREARDAFEAMIWLEAITPKRGFPARAVWSTTADPGQKAEGGSGGLPAKWWPTGDGLWEWKGDTSSDEVNAHFYSVCVFHDYVAEGAEKARAAEHITRIMDHILENGWLLRDMDGEPTRWGRWDPDYLQRPYGMYARGLNGMEAQMYATAAWAVSGGEQKYADAFQQLLDWRYHHHTVRQKLTFPPDFIVPWDDRLAFESLYPLLKYTGDPKMRTVYLRSLARHWEIKRMEQVPWYNFIYGIATGHDCEVEQAIAHMREWPLDPTSHSYHNAHRHDLHPQRDYVQYGAGPRAISPRESEAKRSSRSAFTLNGGSGGRNITEPTAWLEDYWMGRYYGFILPPDTADPALTTVEPWDGVHRGALPYDGPPRPDNLVPDSP